MVPRILIVPAAASDASGVESVVVAGAVELLRRRSRCDLFIAAHRDPKLPETQWVDDTSVPDALAGCSLVAIVGTLGPPGLTNAIEIAFMARLLEIPVALIGVQVPIARTADDAALVHAFAVAAAAVTAADAESAAFLSGCRGRRVDVVAPLELLARAPEASAATAGIVIGCDASVLRPGVLEAIGTVSQELGATLRSFGRVVLAPEGVTCVAAPDESVASLLAAIAGCTLIVAAGDSVLHILAASAGVPSIAWAPQGNAAWHRRLGCSDRILSHWDVETLRSCISIARAESSARVVQRVVPLRAVAWRALGSLADLRGGAWVPSGTFAPPVATVVARACERIVAPALMAGDAPRAEAMLARWQDLLVHEPAWCRAQARVYALNGRDADAVLVLERALAQHPGDRAGRIELARARTRQGTFERARAIWAELALEQLGDAVPAAEIAHLALLQGDTTAALAAWAEALRRDPQHAGSIRAVRALLDAEPRREMEFWSALCTTDANNAGFWQSLGLAALRALEWDAAERSLRRAVELDPSVHAAREALTAVLERQNPADVSQVATEDGRRAPAPPVAGAATSRL